VTKIFNDPATFTQDALAGFASLYPQYVLQVPGGVVRSSEPSPGKTCVIVGGGSGHYPAFFGIVGAGFADGAVVGNVFTSPSAEDAYNVAKAAWAGGGVLLITGNYAGDVMNFNIASERLRLEGLDVRNLYVTDDVASAPVGELHKRRGIAGGFTVFRIAGAAGDSGYSLDDVERVAKKANSNTRSLGIGLKGCTLPGAESALFEVKAGQMGLGLGIHGEPGISDQALPTARSLAEILVDGVLAEITISHGSRIAVIVNGLGDTKYEELFILWNEIQLILVDRDLVLVEPEVGELVTSLDMAGCSLTIMTLDEELERLWSSPTDTPSYKKGDTPGDQNLPRKLITTKLDSVVIPIATEASIKCGKTAVEILRRIEQVMVESEELLGRVDAVAGDGDHGRGMVKGTKAALNAAEKVANVDAGVGTIFISAGREFAAKAGGTSGVLWGAALEAVGNSLGDNFKSLTSLEISQAVEKGMQAIQDLGKAQLGDKTMLDALIPFCDSLNLNIKTLGLSESWEAACRVASEAAQATSNLSPKVGRARPLAEKSLGTPDAGALSMSLALCSLMDLIGNLAS
jgi:dihydroxyacetone kinase